MRDDREKGAEKLSQKSFWESLEQRLEDSSAEQLRDILRRMARGVSPAARRSFLDSLRLPESPAQPAAEQAWEGDKLLDDIRALTQRLQKAMREVESPQEPDWDDSHGQDEEDPYADFLGPVAALFDRAQAAFDYGNLALARAAYENLFALLALEDDYGQGLATEDLWDVDLEESRARYLRAVYETEPTESRPRALLKQFRELRAHPVRRWPTFADLIGISPKPLPEQERFLQACIDLLRRDRGADADAWLREAIRLRQGIAGLEQLALTEGRQRPRAYVDWLNALSGEGKAQEVVAIARKALGALPAGLPIRAVVADQLAQAASSLGDSRAVIEARWEAFQAKPTVARLLDLWEATGSDEDRTHMMQQAADTAAQALARERTRQPTSPLTDEPCLQDDLDEPAWFDKSLLAHAHLLAGDWPAAQKLVARAQVLGWSNSDNPQGLVISFFLALLSGRPLDALPANLRELWRGVLGGSCTGSSWSEPEAEITRTMQRLKRAYAGRQSAASWTAAQQAEYLGWCLDIGRRRTDAIVGNAHRGSYGKAALLTSACAEVLQLRGAAQAAADLLDQTRQRHSRKTSFKAELNDAIGRMQSPTP